MSKTQSISSLQAYQKCPQRYKRRYIDGLSDRDGETRDMQRGSLLHAGLEAALLAAHHGNDPLHAALYEVESYCQRHTLTHEQSEPVEDMLRYYLPLLGIGTQMMPYVHNGKPVVEFSFEVKANGVPFKGKVDAVVVMPDGTVALLDWKSRQNPGGFYSDYILNLDSQLLTYAGALKHGLGIPVTAVAQVQMSAELPATPALKEPEKPKKGVEPAPHGSKASHYSKTMGKTTPEMFSAAIEHLEDAERLAMAEQFFGKMVNDDHFLHFSWLDARNIEAVMRLTLQQAKRIESDTAFLPVLNAYVCRGCPFARNCSEEYLAPRGESMFGEVTK